MMKNLLIIGAGPGIGLALTELHDSFDTVYVVSREKSEIFSHVKQMTGDVTKEIDFSEIEKDSLGLVVYIPSLRAASSEITEEEFEEYMKVGPQGLLKCFHQLRDGGKLDKDALVTSIGSTASESALNFNRIWGSGIYELSKLTQKSLIIQLMKHNKGYRFLNLTLGSIGDGTGVDGGVGYENIRDTIFHIYTTGKSVRYSEVSLVSELDIE